MKSWKSLLKSISECIFNPKYCIQKMLIPNSKIKNKKNLIPNTGWKNKKM